MKKSGMIVNRNPKTLNTNNPEEKPVTLNTQERYKYKVIDKNSFY